MIVEHRKIEQKFKHWRCGGCNTLLGIMYPNKTLAIKHKDLTAYVTGTVKVICRFCKVENNYSTDKTVFVHENIDSI